MIVPVLTAGISLGAVFSHAADPDPWQTITPGGDTQCSDGSPYRFHVRQADPERLLLFFNGGGACWTGQTCDPRGNPTYRVTSGPGSGNDPREYSGAFALENPENPFREWSQVFISYCTGDVHLGQTTARFTRDDGSEFKVRHNGRRNAESALAWVEQELAQPQKILVAGGSAGALSSPLYAAFIAHRYPDAEILQFGGGAAGYRVPSMTALWQQWGAVPVMEDLLSVAKLENEALRPVDLYALAGTSAPGVQFYTYDNAFDATQESFMGLLGAPGPLLPGLDANLEEMRESLNGYRSFVAAGRFHTLLRFDELYTRETGGVRAVDWVEAMLAGSAANVHCEPQECREAP